MHSLLLALPIVLGAFGASAAPSPVILDTDIGDDIDDTWALALLLGMDANLKLIVTASDDTPTKARLTAKILESAGRTAIPIGVGVKTSDRAINQAAWLGDYSLEKYPGRIINDGVDAMIACIKESPVPTTLVVIGPQTNIAEMLKRDPSVADKARLFVMAGSVHIGYDGKEGRQPEWNVFRDLAASKKVFSAPWEITLAPLDICGALRLSGEPYNEVASSPNTLAKTVIENYSAWTNRQQHPADSSSILFDTVAAYMVADESLCEISTVNLSIDDKGNTIPDKAGRPVRCALAWKDRNKFERQLVHFLTASSSSSNP